MFSGGVNCNDWDAICRMVGTSKNTAHILFLSITVQTDTSMCKHFESVPGTLFLHSPFYGLLEICVRLVKHASKAKHLCCWLLWVSQVLSQWTVSKETTLTGCFKNKTFFHQSQRVPPERGDESGVTCCFSI